MVPHDYGTPYEYCVLSTQVVAISRSESKKAFAEKCGAMAFLASSDAAQRLGEKSAGKKQVAQAKCWGSQWGYGVGYNMVGIWWGYSFLD